jgi:predicted DNA-binding transcriptional regulator YafY
MPLNYQSLIRFRVINRCLVDREYVTIDEMKRACERALDIYPIGIRTIEGDISMMRKDPLLGYNAPIEYNRYRKAYRYSDDNYSIDNIPLNEEEMNSVIFASRLLDQFRGVEIFRQFTGSVRKIAEAIDVWREFDDETFRTAIDFEKAYETGGTEFMGQVIDAIKNRCAVKLKYRAFTARSGSVSIIHPYLLKEYRNRWYMVGFSERYRKVRTYCLDRFLNLEKDESIKFIISKFDAKKYYSDVIGISVMNREPLEIDVAFSEIQAQYLFKQPLHSSQQRLADEKGKIVFRFRVVPNYEFISFIMGLGKEAEVLRPKSIRTKIAKRFQESLEKYK